MRKVVIVVAVLLSVNSLVQAQAAPPGDADLRSEVEQLKQLVREQQNRIDALEKEHQTPAPSNSAGPSAARPADRQASDSAATVATNLQATPADKSAH